MRAAYRWRLNDMFSAEGIAMLERLILRELAGWLPQT